MRNLPEVKALFSEEKDAFQKYPAEGLQEVPEQQMTDSSGAGKGERVTPGPGSEYF